jgi:L-amino acid N-acyltransferase YncA
MVYIRWRASGLCDRKAVRAERREGGETMTEIRAARSGDLGAIFEIYDHAVHHTVATFDTEPKTEDQQKRWLEEHSGKFPALVAVQDQQVVGWSSLSRWSDKKGYTGTAEISLYIREGWRDRGIGTRLTDAVLEEGRENGIHVAVARVADTNPASIRILESLGFEHIGIMREVGRKFDRYLDVTLMQKILT